MKSRRRGRYYHLDILGRWAATGAVTNGECGNGSLQDVTAVELDEERASIVEDAREDGDIVVIGGRSKIRVAGFSCTGRMLPTAI